MRSVKEFFVFLKNKIIEAVTGRRPYEEDFEEVEKGYQVSSKKLSLGACVENLICCGTYRVWMLKRANPRERMETWKIAMGYKLLIIFQQKHDHDKNNNDNHHHYYDQVKINHIDIPMGDIEKNESTYADSSIGEGMDITIQVTMVKMITWWSQWQSSGEDDDDYADEWAGDADI